MNNLKEYSDHYSKTSGSLWLYCKDEPDFLDNCGAITNFPGNRFLFKYDVKITGKTLY